MSDSDSPTRKKRTIRLGHRPRAGSEPAPASERRARSGARARQVALQQLTRATPSRDHAAGPAHKSGRRPATGARATGHAGSTARQRPGRRAASNAPGRTEQFDAFAPCPHGLEEVLARELQALDLTSTRVGHAGCHLRADWSGILRVNLHSRLATRVLVQVARATIAHEDDLLALAHETAWERWFGPQQTLRVDTSAIRSPMRSLNYCNLRVKDGICDRLREREGSRPDIDTVRPDARVHLFMEALEATLYVDVSGESLFKRGWRLDKGDAPLRENLAAGLLALSGWTPGTPLLDPFCGSGTILIEAAWQALRVPPGITRPFAFERLRTHDERLWHRLKAEALAHVQPRLEQPLIGVDIDAAAIQAAHANRERARLAPECIEFRVDDARRFPAPEAPGWILTNPPYGERIHATATAFWKQWGRHLRDQYKGWQLGILSSDLDLPGQLRLKARRRTPVYNGALDCRLFQFDLHSDTPPTDLPRIGENPIIG